MSVLTIFPGGQSEMQETFRFSVHSQSLTSVNTEAVEEQRPRQGQILTINPTVAFPSISVWH